MSSTALAAACNSAPETSVDVDAAQEAAGSSVVTQNGANQPTGPTQTVSSPVIVPSAGAPVAMSPEAPLPPTELLLEDFSDGDARLSAPGFQGEWQTYSDGTGQVTPPEETPITPEGGVIQVAGSGFADWGVGLSLDFNREPGAGTAQRGVVDLSDYRGLSLSASGSGVLAVELVTPATTGLDEGGTCTGDGCFGHFATTLVLSEAFESQELLFSSFTQPGWAQEATRDLSQVIGINLLARAEGGPVSIDLGVERLALLTNAPPPVVMDAQAEPGVVVGDGSNPFAGRSLHSGADQAFGAYNSASGAERDLLAKVALNPTAFWLNGGDPSRAGAIVDAGGDDYAVLVAYNIPDRDCSGESAGGAGSEGEYRGWIDGMSQSLQGKTAAVVLEPDALALSCGPATEALIAYAVSSLRQNPGVSVYIDGGHSNWVSAGEMAGRLTNAGIADATGFAVNISNFQPTANLINYGKQLSGLVGGKPFIVDTSRNGQGARGAEWCNPAGAGLGEAPTSSTGDPDVHALLWIKRPGESDGACGQCEGVNAGQFCTGYALELARNSVF